MIKRSEHSFGPGKANTTIQAQWTHQAGPDKEKSKASKVGKKNATKCAVGGGSGGGASSAPVASTEPDDDILEWALARHDAKDEYASNLTQGEIAKEMLKTPAGLSMWDRAALTLAAILL